MSEDYRAVLGAIRSAYARLQSGALRPSVWKHEGASTYTVQRPRAISSGQREPATAEPAPQQQRR